MLENAKLISSTCNWPVSVIESTDKKEEVKIAEVEKLFDTLSAPKKKKKVVKKKLLVEPEKIKEPIIEEEVVIDKTPEELTIIDKVSKQLSDMKVAKKIDEDKIKSLERAGVWISESPADMGITILEALKNNE